jgi:hypothetical protein
VTQVNDVVRIKMCAEMFGQEICNVFYYLVSVWTGNADFDDVANSFLGNVRDPIQALQDEDLTYQELVIDNVTNGVDFLILPLTGSGTRTNVEALPSFNALTFGLVRTTKLTRNGSKRLGGFSEDQISGNDVTMSGAAQAQLKNALSAFLQDQSPAVEYQLKPIIVGRNPNGSLDLTRINLVSGITNPTVSTQNSRKATRSGA